MEASKSGEVIAAGFERWDDGTGAAKGDRVSSIFETPEPVDIFADATGGSEDELDLGDDDFDVPSFLR